MPWAWVVPPFLVFASAKFGLAVWGWWYAYLHPHVALSVEVAMRISAAMLMWRLCNALVGRPVSAKIRRFEPYMFLLFCSHMILIWLFAQKIGLLTGPLDTPFYPIFFLAHPFILLGATLVLGQVLQAISPSMAALMSGGRLKPEPARSA